ncbi:MAG: 4Fe-4S binding protein [Candidatus Njordarchaeales archaeon]
MMQKENEPSKRITIIRSIIQFISFFVIFGGVFGIAASVIVLPVMIPAGNPYTTVMGAWQLLEIMVTAAIFPYLAIAVISLGSLIFGRFFCGWVCPFGFISDLTSYLGRKMRVSNKTNIGLFKISLFVAALFLFIDFSIGYNEAIGTSIASYFGEFSREPSTIIDPTSSLFSMLFWYIYWRLYPKTFQDLSQLTKYPGVFWFRIFIIIIAILSNYYLPRFWCRTFCPLGGLMGLGSQYSFLKIYVDPKKCLGEHCRLCEKNCLLNIPILSFKSDIRHPQCIMCLMCAEACPTNAIKAKFSLS